MAAKKKGKPKKTSLADIANSLGVSRTLVSMVLNGRGDENGINSDTQKRVLAKAKELNYKPNQLARGLRLGRTNTIGLIVADISNPFYATVARGIEDLAGQHGFRLMVCSSDEDSQKESELIQMFRDRQADGLIISTTQQNNDEIMALREDNYPFVLIDRHLEGLDINSVTVDNHLGATQAVDHLAQNGAKKIGLLKISPTHLSTMRDRVSGFLDATKTHMLASSPDLIQEIPFNRVKEGVYEALEYLLGDEVKADAIFAANNNLAAACLEYARENGLNIPQDIALLSFDDVRMFKFSYPTITAVAQPLQEIGRQAIKLLLDEILTKEPVVTKKQIVLPTDLVIRESCRIPEKSI